jgi:hypothetical protein
MTELRSGTSPPPVRMPIRFFAIAPLCSPNICLRDFRSKTSDAVRQCRSARVRSRLLVVSSRSAIDLNPMKVEAGCTMMLDGSCPSSGPMSRLVCQSAANCPSQDTCSGNSPTSSTGGLYRTCHPPMDGGGPG